MVVQQVLDQVVKELFYKLSIMNKTILTIVSIFVLTNCTDKKNNIDSNKAEQESKQDNKRKFYKIEELCYTTDSTIKDSINLNTIIKEYE